MYCVVDRHGPKLESDGCDRLNDRRNSFEYIEAISIWTEEE
jgi:hypothetical protein